MRAILAGKVECYNERPRLVRVEALGNGERVKDRSACPGLSGGFFSLQREVVDSGSRGELQRHQEAHYCKPPRTDVIRFVLNPSQCIRPT